MHIITASVSIFINLLLQELLLKSRSRKSSARFGRNAPSCQGVENFQYWLFTVAKNHALNALRKMVKERAEQLNWEKQQLHLPQDAELTMEDRLQLLHQAISQLPPQQKKVFILSRYQRRKYVEIAKELNLSRETVKSYLQIATSSIRKYVSSHLPLFFMILLSRLFY